MEDKELLELAAKAAGYAVVWYGGSPGIYPASEPFRWQSGTRWSPLTDDGDRHRLIQKLKLSVGFDDCSVWKRLPDGRLIQEYWGGDCGDEAHAVLRVAAEIGKAMP